MRKRVLLAVFCSAFLCFLPGKAEAVNYCELVNGNGIEFGAEVACGDEHFYVFDSNEDSVTLFAKYNLNAGETTYREPINWPLDPGISKDDYCLNVTQENGGFYGKTLENASSFYKNYGDNANYCFYSKDTREGKLHQLEEARSAHWDENGNYIYPQVGDVYINNAIGIAQYGDNTYGLKFDFGYFPQVNGNAIYQYDSQSSSKYPKAYNRNLYDFTITPFEGNKGVAPVLYEYMEGLKNEGYNVLGITVPTMDDLNMAATRLGKAFDYENEWIEQGETPEYDTTPRHSRNMIIKDYFAGEYSWIWDRSYWLRTAVPYVGNNPSSGAGTLFFVNAYGDICSTNVLVGGKVGNCSTGVASAFGLGVRPLLKVDAIKFRIRTESGDGGKIESPTSAFGEEGIAFRAAAKAGYRLASLTVTTEAGEEITLSDEELEHDNEGNIIIRANHFAMPFANVVIHANWEKETVEPETEEPVEPEAEEPVESEAEEPEATLISTPEEDIEAEKVDSAPATLDDIGKYFTVLVASFATLIAISTARLVARAKSRK